MSRSFSIRTGRPGRLIRAVAIFFLLHTGADIALPQYFCPEDFGGVAAANSIDSVKPEQAADSAPAFDKHNGAPSETPSDQLPHEEDCFCCCAHVLPSTNLARLEIYEFRSMQPVNETGSLPSAPVREMYHPPRIA